MAATLAPLPLAALLEARMPSYVFTGTERVYPETRDANGRHLGEVTPGDIRFFDEPPNDGLWVPEIGPGQGLGDDGEGGIAEPEPDAGDAPQDETAGGDQDPEPGGAEQAAEPGE